MSTHDSNSSELIRVKGEGSFTYVLLLAAVAAVGGFLFGFDSGVINGTVDSLKVALHADSLGAGFSVASVLLGCAVGAGLAGTLADTFGRKPIMLVTALVFAFSAWGSGIADSMTAFVVYRLIGGLAVGAASVIAPAYISEVAPAYLRGRLASLQQLAIVIGLFTAFLSNYLIARAAGASLGDAPTPEGGMGVVPLWFGYQAWQWMFWVEIIPALAYFVGALLIPESPRFLVAKGKRDEAAKVFAKTIGGNVIEKIQEVEGSLQGQTKVRLRDIFANKYLRIVTIGIVLSVLQQFVGINVVFYYGSVLWQAAGFTEDQSLLINVISGAVNITSTLGAIALVDKLGRKPLLLGGSIAMTVCLGIMAIIFSTVTTNAQGQPQLDATLGWIALLAANGYVFGFGISWGPVVWVLLGEMFPNRIRGAALAVAASAQWIANFAITMTFPIMLDSIGLGGSYATYAIFAAISIAFVMMAVPETKGKKLEDM